MPHIIPFFSEDLDLEQGLARLAGEIRQETRQLAKLSDVELLEAGPVSVPAYKSGKYHWHSRGYCPVCWPEKKK